MTGKQYNAKGVQLLHLKAQMKALRSAWQCDVNCHDCVLFGVCEALSYLEDQTECVDLSSPCLCADKGNKEV